MVEEEDPQAEAVQVVEVKCFRFLLLILTFSSKIVNQSYEKLIPFTIGMSFFNTFESVISLKGDYHSIFTSVRSHCSTHIVYNDVFWMKLLNDFLFNSFSFFFISSVCNSKGNIGKISDSFLYDFKHTFLKPFLSTSFQVFLLFHLEPYLKRL